MFLSGLAPLKIYRPGVLVAAFVAIAALIGAAPADEPGAKWYSILTEGGLLVGHASHEIVPTGDGTEIVDTQVIDVQDEGSPPTLQSPSPVERSVNLSWRTVQTEDRTGRTVSIESVSSVGRTEKRTVAQIADGSAEITRQTSAETRNIRVALPQGVRFDSGDGLLPSWNPATTPRLDFQDFDIDAMKVERVTIELVPGATRDPQGRVAALRKRYEGTELRAITRLLLDANGNILEVYQPMFGSSLTIRQTDKDTALYSHFALRALVNAMTKSPFRISQSAIEGHIRYRFSFRDGVEFALPQTGEQRVTVEPGIATVDICDGCGPGVAGDEADLATEGDRRSDSETAGLRCAQDGTAVAKGQAPFGQGRFRRPLFRAGDAVATRRRLHGCGRTARGSGAGRRHSHPRRQRARLFKAQLSRRQQCVHAAQLDARLR